MSIEVRELCRSFHGVTALDHVNLTLDDGVIYGLFGRNGAGKSTLLSIIAAHVLPDAGSVTMDGVRVASDGPSLRGDADGGTPIRRFRPGSGRTDAGGSGSVTATAIPSAVPRTASGIQGIGRHLRAGRLLSAG